MRRLWPDVRNVLAMQSRRRDKRSAKLPLVLRRDGAKEVILVPRTDFPTYLVTPLFPPPAISWSSRPMRGVFANLDMIHLCGPTFQEASKLYPEAGFVGAHTNFSPEEVGSWWGESVNGTHGGLHEIRVMCSQPGSHIHAFVRLFAQFGAPEYHVWLGPADPEFVASSDWPSVWDQNRILIPTREGRS